MLKTILSPITFAVVAFATTHLAAADQRAASGDEVAKAALVQPAAPQSSEAQGDETKPASDQGDEAKGS